MNAQHTPTPWHTGAGPSKYVFVPGNAKPINAGSIERSAHIVKCVNAHDALVAALKALLIVAEHGECEAMHPDVADNMARAALAAAGEDAP